MNTLTRFQNLTIHTWISGYKAQLHDLEAAAAQDDGTNLTAQRVAEDLGADLECRQASMEEMAAALMIDGLEDALEVTESLTLEEAIKTYTSATPVEETDDFSRTKNSARRLLIILLQSLAETV